MVVNVLILDITFPLKLWCGVEDVDLAFLLVPLEQCVLELVHSGTPYRVDETVWLCFMDESIWVTDELGAIHTMLPTQFHVVGTIKGWEDVVLDPKVRVFHLVKWVFWIPVQTRCVDLVPHPLPHEIGNVIKEAERLFVRERRFRTRRCFGFERWLDAFVGIYQNMHNHRGRHEVCYDDPEERLRVINLLHRLGRR